MIVPEEFRKVIRKKAGEKDKSMFKYLKDLADNMDNENKKFKFKW